jgi:hypothetical protein
MPVPVISEIPTPPSRSDSPDTFSARMIALAAALATFVSEMNAQADYLDDSAIEAAAASAAGLSASGAAIWVTGTTYAIGDKRWSPADYKTYRRKTNGAGATDPSADSTNWALISGTGNVKSAATQVVENKTIVDAVLEGTVTHDIYAIVDAAGVPIDPANGDWQTWTLGAARTPTAGAGWEDGKSIELWVADGASAYAVTWTIVESWLDDFEPVLPTSGYAKISLSQVGGLIYGAWLGNI